MTMAIFVTVLIGILFALALTILFRKDASLPDRAAVFIACLSLLVSLCGFFREQIFPFSAKLLAKGALLTLETQTPAVDYAIIIPCVFVNDGLSGGVVDQLAMHITQENGRTHRYIPVIEIDMQKFVRGKRKLHASNFGQIWLPFHLKAGESLVKTLMFVPGSNKQYPPAKWQPGKHNFTIYMTTATGREQEPEAASSFSYSINSKTLHEVSKGITVSLMEELKGD